MESSRLRRHWPLLSVDRLEDRRLLSEAGPLRGWDALTFGSATPSPRAEFAPASGSSSFDDPARAMVAPSTLRVDCPSASSFVMSEAVASRSGPAFGGGSSSTGAPAAVTPTPVTWTASVVASPTIAAHQAVDVLAPVAVAASTGDRGVNPPGLVARSIPVTPTSRVEAVATPEPQASSSAPPPTPAPSAVIPAWPLEVAAGSQARAVLSPSPSSNPGSPDAPGRPSAGPLVPNEVPEVRSSSDAPARPGRGEGSKDVPDLVEGEAAEVVFAEGAEVPAPDLAGLITGLVPFARSSLEEAVDRLLEPFDGLRSPSPGSFSPIGLVSASLAAALTVATVEIAIRLRRSKEEGESDGRPASGFVPDIPRPWRATR